MKLLNCSLIVIIFSFCLNADAVEIKANKIIKNEVSRVTEYEGGVTLNLSKTEQLVIKADNVVASTDKTIYQGHVKFTIGSQDFETSSLEVYSAAGELTLKTDVLKAIRLAQ